MLNTNGLQQLSPTSKNIAQPTADPQGYPTTLSWLV
jgi:hypothetical protein